MLAFEELIDRQLEEKKIIDSYGIKYFTDVDIDICDYVSKKLFYTNIENVNPGDRIDVRMLVGMSLEELKVFGDDICSKVNGILEGTPILQVDTDEIFQLGTDISFSKNDNGVVDKDSGLVEKFVVPNNLYELAGYSFGYEQIHAMKDTNYNEYINIKILGETIPIFYELMIYSPEEILKRELIKVRMNYIFINSYEYVLFSNVLRASLINKSVSDGNEESVRKRQFYEYACLTKVCYLNSFYYALILYNMYKETPKKILDLVSRVLRHEITTLQMLELLGIYGDIRGEVFEKEIQNIRKLVK